MPSIPGKDPRQVYRWSNLLEHDPNNHVPRFYKVLALLRLSVKDLQFLPSYIRPANTKTLSSRKLVTKLALNSRFQRLYKSSYLACPQCSQKQSRHHKLWVQGWSSLISSRSMTYILLKTLLETNKDNFKQNRDKYRQRERYTRL